MKLTHWAVLALTALLFGSSFPFIKLSVEAVPPFTLAAIRASGAAMALTLVLYLSGARLPGLGRNWLPLTVLGVLTAIVPYVAIAWGQQIIDASLGGILFATIPVFSVLVAPLVLADERYTAMRFAGSAVAFAGVILTIGIGALGTLNAQVAGAAMTVLAALCYASGGIYARTQPQLSPMVIAAGQLLVASAVLIPLGLTIEGVPAMPPPEVMGYLATIALLNTAAPVVLIFWLVRNAGATNASLVAYLMPLASVAIGVLALGETLSLNTLLGFAMILGGAALVSGLGPARTAKPREAA